MVKLPGSESRAKHLARFSTMLHYSFYISLTSGYLSHLIIVRLEVSFCKENAWLNTISITAFLQQVPYAHAMHHNLELAVLPMCV